MNDFPEDIKAKLENYDFVENPKKLKDGIHVRYISKNNPYRVKGGYYRKMHEGDIMEMYQGKRTWYVYYNNNYCYYRVREPEPKSFKQFLRNLVKNNFKL
jgi:hypothetical protein